MSSERVSPKKGPSKKAEMGFFFPSIKTTFPI